MLNILNPKLWRGGYLDKNVSCERLFNSIEVDIR